MLRISTGRNTRSARRNAAIEGAKYEREGEEVNYFILPQKTKRKRSASSKTYKWESDDAYLRRIWRLNQKTIMQSDGRIPEDQKTFKRFKEEVKARQARHDGNLRKAIIEQVRVQYTPEEQLEQERRDYDMNKEHAIKKFEETAGVKFNPKVAGFGYDSSTGAYTYGNVRFGWKYIPGKRGNPGGLHFFIENVQTGESWTDDDLMEEYLTHQADLAEARENRAMHLAKLKEENPEEWQRLDNIRQARNARARERYRKLHHTKGRKK